MTPTPSAHASDLHYGNMLSRNDAWRQESFDCDWCDTLIGHVPHRHMYHLQYVCCDYCQSCQGTVLDSLAMDNVLLPRDRKYMYCSLCAETATHRRDKFLLCEGCVHLDAQDLIDRYFIWADPEDPKMFLTNNNLVIMAYDEPITLLPAIARILSPERSRVYLYALKNLVWAPNANINWYSRALITDFIDIGEFQYGFLADCAKDNSPVSLMIMTKGPHDKYSIVLPGWDSYDDYLATSVADMRTFLDCSVEKMICLNL
jgi:hypothetical protein